MVLGKEFGSNFDFKTAIRTLKSCFRRQILASFPSREGALEVTSNFDLDDFPSPPAFFPRLLRLLDGLLLGMGARRAEDHRLKLSYMLLEERGTVELPEELSSRRESTPPASSSLISLKRVEYMSQPLWPFLLYLLVLSRALRDEKQPSSGCSFDRSSPA